VQGKKLPPEALKALELMPISIEEMLFDARRDHNKSCLLKRIIPVINWDLSVLSCCNYNYHRIASNYLQISIQEIIDKRYGSDLCGTCQENSLHRYFNPVYYSDRVKKMVKA
jgi:hypothetical protein